MDDLVVVVQSRIFDMRMYERRVDESSAKGLSEMNPRDWRRLGPERILGGGDSCYSGLFSSALGWEFLFFLFLVCALLRLADGVVFQEADDHDCTRLVLNLRRRSVRRV